ncbi:hypothetical protein ACLESO_24650 [Pyxidicoccus sp. 3LG]
MPVSPDETLASLLHPERREAARRRRLAVLVACALPRPVPLSTLVSEFGEAFQEGAELACDEGLCELRPGGELVPAGPATLDMAINQLEVAEVRATLARLARLASSPDEALLLASGRGPAG